MASQSMLVREDAGRAREKGRDMAMPVANHVNFWNSSFIGHNPPGAASNIQPEDFCDVQSLAHSKPRRASMPAYLEPHIEFCVEKPADDVVDEGCLFAQIAEAVERSSSSSSTLSHLETSSLHQPQPSELRMPTDSHTFLLIPTGVSTPPTSTATAEEIHSWNSSPGRMCQNCHTTQTPFWRRASDGNFYCNACGLYLRAHKKMRPVALQQSRASKRIRVRADVCINCNAKETPLWRRIATGETVCNACGLYYKLHGSHRPMEVGKGSNSQRGGGARPRIIMPKASPSNALWHHYLPPQQDYSHPARPSTHDQMSPMFPRQPLSSSSASSQASYKAMRSNSYGGSAGLSFPMASLNFPTNNALDFGHPFPLLPNASHMSGFLPTGFPHSMMSNFVLTHPPTIPEEKFGEAETMALRERSAVDGSLDDSMRWFSSTCLESTYPE